MRYTGPKCKLCRREGTKLFLKGERCTTQKCAIVRKNYAPGMHGGDKKFGKRSEYGKQLREKQKAKRTFGMSERQFSKYYKIASRKTGMTGPTFLQMLERRLDNIVYKAGFAASRDQARQFISHGLFQLNGKKVTCPSILAKVNDKFAVREKMKKQKIFSSYSQKKDTSPKWLKVDIKNLNGEILSLPEKDDLEANINSSLIVEFYSK